MQLPQQTRTVRESEGLLNDVSQLISRFPVGADSRWARLRVALEQLVDSRIERLESVVALFR